MMIHLSNTSLLASPRYSGIFGERPLKWNNTPHKKATEKLVARMLAATVMSDTEENRREVAELMVFSFLSVVQ